MQACRGWQHEFISIVPSVVRLLLSQVWDATQLFAKILADLANHFGLTMTRLLGVVDHVDSAIDIALFSHSLVRFNLAKNPYRGVRIVRDPRGIWLSGYWYHRRCTEGWCINTNFDITPPIQFPRVPYSQGHRSEVWKRDYLSGLNGRSYQENLLALDPDAGMAFEGTRYAAWTAEAMAEWQPERNTIDIKLESIAAGFDETMNNIFRHFGFTGSHLTDALRISQLNDVARMTDGLVAGNSHITSRDVSLWRHHLSAQGRRGFQEQHAALMESLGYPI